MNRFAIAALLVGVALLVTGFALMYRPLGFLSCGALLLAAGLSSMRHKRGA